MVVMPSYFLEILHQTLPLPIHLRDIVATYWNAIQACGFPVATLWPTGELYFNNGMVYHQSVVQIAAVPMKIATLLHDGRLEIIGTCPAKCIAKNVTTLFSGKSQSSLLFRRITPSGNSVDEGFTPGEDSTRSFSNSMELDVYEKTAWQEVHWSKQTGRLCFDIPSRVGNCSGSVCREIERHWPPIGSSNAPKCFARWSKPLTMVYDNVCDLQVNTDSCTATCRDGTILYIWQEGLRCSQLSLGANIGRIRERHAITEDGELFDLKVGQKLSDAIAMDAMGDLLVACYDNGSIYVSQWRGRQGIILNDVAEGDAPSPFTDVCLFLLGFATLRHQTLILWSNRGKKMRVFENVRNIRRNRNQLIVFFQDGTLKVIIGKQLSLRVQLVVSSFAPSQWSVWYELPMAVVIQDKIGRVTVVAAFDI